MLRRRLPRTPRHPFPSYRSVCINLPIPVFPTLNLECHWLALLTDGSSPAFVPLTPVRRFSESFFTIWYPFWSLETCLWSRLVGFYPKIIPEIRLAAQFSRLERVLLTPKCASHQHPSLHSRLPPRLAPRLVHHLSISGTWLRLRNYTTRSGREWESHMLLRQPKPEWTAPEAAGYAARATAAKRVWDYGEHDGAAATAAGRRRIGWGRRSTILRASSSRRPQGADVSS